MLFFNLSCHLFSYPLSLKQTSSFTKTIFLLDFLKKLREGKKSFLLALSLCRSRQILGYVFRSIKCSPLIPHVQVRLTCLPSKIHVFLFNQISCLQSVVCEYSIIFIRTRERERERKRERERERERIYIYIYIYIVSLPYIQVRLTCLPSNIHVFLFKQISCLQGVVCEYIPSYYVFFFTMCDLSPLNFPALKML